MGVVGVPGEGSGQDGQQGVVPLAAALASLREELFQAWYEARDKSVRFKPSPVELTLQVGVTSAGKGSLGVRWWLLELGGEASRESAVTQTVKITLEPRMFDEDGKPLEVLIEALDVPTTGPRAAYAEVPLDAAD